MASVMIVEDDLDTLEILQVVLQRKYAGVEIRTARNGRDGVERFRERKVDLVVTDVNMPLMDGIEMVREIHRMEPGVPFIFITADTGRGTLEQSVGTGVKLVHYILKPVAYHDLFQAIEKALAEAGAAPF